MRSVVFLLITITVLAWTACKDTTPTPISHTDHKKVTSHDEAIQIEGCCSKEQKQSFQQVARTQAATVYIKVESNTTKSAVHGSGAIISADGCIVTNYHVLTIEDNNQIYEAHEIKVTTHDQRVFLATVIGKDLQRDLALIKINERHLPFLEFADSDKAYVGDLVLAVGYPLSLNQTATSGVIGAKTKAEIQTDVLLNSGNSGGPLVNVLGQLIGINTSVLTHGNRYSIGYSFSIPANVVKEFVIQTRGC